MFLFKKELVQRLKESGLSVFSRGGAELLDTPPHNGLMVQTQCIITGEAQRWLICHGHFSLLTLILSFPLFVCSSHPSHPWGSHSQTLISSLLMQRWVLPFYLLFSLHSARLGEEVMIAQISPTQTLMLGESLVWEAGCTPSCVFVIK